MTGNATSSRTLQVNVRQICLFKDHLRKTNLKKECLESANLLHYVLRMKCAFNSYLHCSCAINYDLKVLLRSRACRKKEKYVAHPSFHPYG